MSVASAINCEHCNLPVLGNIDGYISAGQGVHDRCIEAYSQREEKVEEFRKRFERVIDACSGEDVSILQEAIIKAVRYNRRINCRSFLGFLKMVVRDKISRE